MFLSKQDRDHIEAYLAELSMDDLNWVLSRFCGPNNYLLSIKKYGFAMPKELVEQEIFERLLLGKS